VHTHISGRPPDFDIQTDASLHPPAELPTSAPSGVADTRVTFAAIASDTAPSTLAVDAAPHFESLDVIPNQQLSSPGMAAVSPKSPKTPLPPRQHPLKRTSFAPTVEIIQSFRSPMTPGSDSESVSLVYDSFVSSDSPPPQTPLQSAPPSAAVAAPSPPSLPPPFGAGYIYSVVDVLSPFEREGSRVVFSIDSRCEPFNIIRRDVVERAGLKIFPSATVLYLGDLNNKVTSKDMVLFQLRVVINERPRVFKIQAVVWDTLAGELIISEKTALATGLTLFVHSNEMRSLLLGQEAISSTDDKDTIGDVPSTVASILGEEDDQDVMETISPVESLRQAMTVYDTVDDEWVNEELCGPLKGVFGPLPPEPAKVPALEFDVDEDSLRKETFGNTQLIRLPPSSPHGQDVIDAQWDELKGFNVLVDAYPDIGPGPIANISFTVPKPGVKRPKRPSNYKRNVVPLEADLAALHREYTASLTADRLVVNFGPSNRHITVQHFAMPSVQENIAKLSKYKFWAKIDIVKAYWGIPVHPRCYKWLYTIAPGGKAGYWIRAPMGCAPVCAWFQYVIQGVLKRQSAFVLCYADDILIGADSEKELRRRIRAVLREIFDAGFRLNPKKCQFKPTTSIQYLGWVISDGKIFPAENCMQKIAAMQKPTALPANRDDKERRQVVRRFLGLVLYLGAYVPFHAEQLRPLHDLTATTTKDTADDPVSVAQRSLPPSPKKKGKASCPKKFVWTDEADAAWDWAAQQISQIKPLYAPTYAEGSWLEVYSDASKRGWGGILVEFRKDDPKPYVIASVSGAFTGSQLNWAVNVKEAFALFRTIQRFRVYLHLHQFVINVDHRNLLWMTMSVNEMIVRMAVSLQQHRYLMCHISSEANVVSDILSRSHAEQDVQPAPDFYLPSLAATVTSDTDETVAPSDLFSDAPSDSDSDADSPLSMLVVAPIGPDQADPMIPRLRAGDSPQSRRQNRRVSRQPDAPADAVVPADDGLPIGPDQADPSIPRLRAGDPLQPRLQNRRVPRQPDASADAVVPANDGLPIGPDQADPSIPRLRAGDLLQPRHQNRRVPRQPDAPADAVAPADDGLPIGPDQADPMIPRPRAGDPPPPRRRNRRVPRQPDAPADAVAPADDGLPIFDVGVEPPPPLHRISTEHYHIIKSFHGNVNPHTGVIPLTRALREHGYEWDTLQADVAHFVATCHACQLERLRRRGPSSLPYRSIIIPTRLFDMWTFDILGPLDPCALTGSRWLYCGVEETSKLMMLGHSVSSATMELVMYFLQVFSVFGLPRIIRSDLGPQFLSRACEEFCRVTGIEHKFGIADRHQSDGVVENAASLVWPYLRLAAHDLRRYEVWTPLLCQVQLACNALARDVLGGASASELVFNRKIKPMRFLRPEAIPLVADEAPRDQYEVSSFIADQASMQLRAIHRADNERHRRYRNHMDLAAERADGVEDLDWVRVGQLVSIPHPDHQTFRRPNKWALLRRGPYEVVAMSEGGSTVTLVDVNARFRNENPQPFTYPKVWLHPYTRDTLVLDDPIPPPPGNDDLPALQLLTEPDIIGAVLRAVPIDPLPLPSSPRDVRNFKYEVRWCQMPHTDNSIEAYHMVWHTSAFAEFIQGSSLTGHVPPTAYALKHRNHVNQLLQRQQPDREVALVDPSALEPNRILRNYLPGEQWLRPNSLRASQQQSDERLSQDSSSQRSQQQEP
jgi:hypothetical protein